MSLPASSSLTAWSSFLYVTFLPGGPETARSWVLTFGAAAEHAFTAARKARLAESNAVPSKPVYGFAPLTTRFHRASKAARAGAPSDVAAVPRRPSAGERGPFRTSSFRRASVISVREACHFPVRTSDGANFAKVSGKSMITYPAGL